MIIVEEGPLGIKWKQKEGDLNVYDNRMGFTCKLCGCESFGFQAVAHNDGCTHPWIGTDEE